MTTSYVTQVDGAYRITGTRVSLDSVVYAFLNGSSPESIVDSFPVLSLEQVYGAVTLPLTSKRPMTRVCTASMTRGSSHGLRRKAASWCHTTTARCHATLRPL